MDLLEAFKRAGVLIQNDHFVLNSGLHTDQYFNKDKIFTLPMLFSDVSEALAELIPSSSNPLINAIAGPAYGGDRLAGAAAVWRAANIDSSIQVLCVDEAKDGSGPRIRGGFADLISDWNLWLTDDVLTTGKALRITAELFRAAGANIIGVSVVCDRRKDKTVETIPGIAEISSLIQLDIPNFDAGECPFCQEERPINTDLGHGKEFLDAQENAG